MLNVEYLIHSGEKSGIFQAEKTLPLTKNFALGELANNQGDPKKEQYLMSQYSQMFNTLLQTFRTLYNKPIDPTSGYRQEAYNKKVGGDVNSLHRKACACDFIDTYKKDAFWMISTWLRILFKAGVIGAINIYDNSGYYRYHLEAFSDVYLGYTKCRIRVYTSKAHYEGIKAFYEPLGVNVVYAGN